MGCGLGSLQVRDVRRLFQTLVIGAMLIAPMVSFSAIHFEESWTNAPVNSTFSPLDGSRYRFVMPDGTYEDFTYDQLAMYPFSGRGKWVGEWSDERRDYIRLFRLDRNGRPARGGQEVLFKGGRLLYACVGTQKKPLKLAFSSVTDGEDAPDLESLWQVDERVRQQEQGKASGLWSQSGRLRLWYDNPNMAAVIFLQLILVSLAGMLFIKRWPLRVAAGLMTPLLLAGLLKTSSRGSLVALVVGAVLLIVFWLAGLVRERRLKWNGKTLTVCLIAVVLLLVLGYIVTHIAGGRFGAGLLHQDASTDRLALWGAAPQMILDAPGGWGFGNSGSAYLSWYGDLSRTHVVRTLINTHLTWLVELGSVGRILYVFGWLLALGVTLRSACRGLSPLPLALVLSFFVACIFNPVGEAPELWLVPVGAFGVAIRQFLRSNRSSLWIPFGGALVLTVLVVCTWLALTPGRKREGVSVRASEGAVRLKDGTPALWIVDDREYGCALSSYMLTGREIRGQYVVEPDLPPLGYVEVLDDLPSEARHVVVGGMSCLDYVNRWENGTLSVKPERLVFISPPFPPSRVPEGLVASCDFQMIVGELAADHWPKGTSCPEWTAIIQGARLYIPAWIDYALGRMDPDDDCVRTLHRTNWGEE